MNLTTRKLTTEKANVLSLDDLLEKHKEEESQEYKNFWFTMRELAAANIPASKFNDISEALYKEYLINMSSKEIEKTEDRVTSLWMNTDTEKRHLLFNLIGKCHEASLEAFKRENW